MLEQQQTEALNSLNSKSSFSPTSAQVGGFGQSYYNPNVGGFQSIPGYRGVKGTGYTGMATNYLNEVGAAMGFAQNFGSRQYQNAQNNMRNAMLNADMESMSPFWANQSKINAQTQEQMGTNLGAKFTTGTLSAASALSNVAGQGLVSLLGGGFFGSMLFGGAAGVAVGGTIDIMADQMKQNYAYDRYLQQNSYRFINMQEANNDRAPAGFNRRERWSAADYLRHFGTEMKISDDDTMMLLKNFTEGDLLRQVEDVETFKEQMTKMTKAAKTMALSLNTTLEETAKIMAELKEKGIDTRDYENLAAGAKIVGSMTGESASDVLDFTTDFAQSLVQGTGIDIDAVQSGVSKSYAYMGKILSDAEKTGNEDIYNYIVNSGGEEGATQKLIQTYVSDIQSENSYALQFTAAALQKDKNGEISFNESRTQALIRGLTNGTINMSDVGNQATENLQALGIDNIGNWMSYGGEMSVEAFLKNPELANSWYQALIEGARRQTGMTGFDNGTVLSEVFGWDKNTSHFIGAIGEEFDGLYQQGYGSYIDRATIAQTVIDQANSQKVGLGYQVKNWWSGVKDTMGDSISWMANGLNAFGQMVSDAYYGKDYGDVSSMLSGVSDWSPYNSLSESLIGLQEAYINMGDTQSAKKYSQASFGGDGFGDTVTEREFYKNIEDLQSALKKLAEKVNAGADNVDEFSESLATAVREYSEKYGVSENAIVAAMEATGKSSAEDAENTAQRLSELLYEKGGNQADAVSAYLYENGVSKYDVYRYSSAVGGAVALNDADTVGHLTGNMSSETLLMDDTRTTNASNGLSAEDNAAVSKMTQVFSEYSSANLSENIRDIIDYNYETRKMIQEFANASADDKGNTVWGQMSLQERSQRVQYANESVKKNRSEGYGGDSTVDDDAEAISNEISGIYDLSNPLMNYGMDEQSVKDIQGVQDRVYVKSIDKDGNKTYALASSKEEAANAKTKVVVPRQTASGWGAAELSQDELTDEQKQIDYAEAGRQIMNQEVEDKYKGLSINDAIKQTEEDLAKNREEASKAGRELDEIYANLKRNDASFLADAIDAGAIDVDTDDSGNKTLDMASYNQYLSANGISVNDGVYDLANQYLNKKSYKDQYDTLVSSGETTSKQFGVIKEEAGQREAGYVTLARALGWKEDKFGISDGRFQDVKSIQSLMKKVASGKATLSVGEDGRVSGSDEEMKAIDLLSDSIFSGMDGRKVDSSNRDTVKEGIVDKLTSNGIFDVQLATDTTEKFLDNVVNSEYGKEGTLDENAQRAFVTEIMKALNGDGEKKSDDGTYKDNVIGHLDAIDRNLSTLVANHGGAAGQQVNAYETTYSSSSGAYNGNTVTTFSSEGTPGSASNWSANGSAIPAVDN